MPAQRQTGGSTLPAPSSAAYVGKNGQQAGVFLGGAVELNENDQPITPRGALLLMLYIDWYVGILSVLQLIRQKMLLQGLHPRTDSRAARTGP